MADIWCRKLDCKYNEGKLYKDARGAQGYCKLEEVEITSEGRCKNDRD